MVNLQNKSDGRNWYPRHITCAINDCDSVGHRGRERTVSAADAVPIPFCGRERLSLRLRQETRCVVVHAARPVFCALRFSQLSHCALQSARRAPISCPILCLRPAAGRLPSPKKMVCQLVTATCSLDIRFIFQTTTFQSFETQPQTGVIAYGGTFHSFSYKHL